MVRAIRQGGFDVTIVDPDEPPSPELRIVHGLGSDEASLREAGIAEAEGVVAGSDDDTANLAMAMAARQLNPDIFVILRQNRARNRSLFKAFDAEMTMVPSEIIANECLACLRAKHLSSFLAMAYTRGNAWAETVTARLQPIVGHGSPDFWSCTLDTTEAPGLLDAMQRWRGQATLARPDPRHRRPGRALPCRALLLVRDGRSIELPRGHDRAARRRRDPLRRTANGRGRRMLQTLRNANTADYVLTGRDRSSSVLARLLAGGRLASRRQIE